MEDERSSDNCHYEESFDCDIENIPAILDFIGMAAVHHGLDGSFVFDVKVAVDEACTNIIDYNCSIGGKMKISVEVDSLDFTVEITNHGKPFNPDTVKTPDMDLPISQMRIGGLGIYFMKQLMDKINYQSKDGLNVLTMVKRHSKRGER